MSYLSTGDISLKFLPVNHLMYLLNELVPACSACVCIKGKRSLPSKYVSYIFRLIRKKEEQVKISNNKWRNGLVKNILREKKDIQNYAVFLGSFKGIFRSWFNHHSMVKWNCSEKTLRYGLSLPFVHIMLLRFGVFLCILGAVTQTAGACAPCPSLCSCALRSGTTDECEVDCQGRGLKSLPTEAELPASSMWKIVKL